MRNRRDRRVALDAVTDAGSYSVTYQVSDFKYIVLDMASIADSDQVVQVQGGMGDDYAPATAQGVDNNWSYLYITDLATKTGYAGSVGATVSGAEYRKFSVDVDGMDYVSFHVSTGTAGAITVGISGYSE